jgi:NDP-sugar pyrophosphorylase family protein
MNSYQTFAQSNHELLEGKFTGLLPRISPYKDTKIWRHNRTKVHRNTVLQNSVLIEGGSQIEKSCMLNRVVINKDCLIRPRVFLKNCIVLPNTVINSNQDFENAIISPTEIIQIN